MLQQSIQQQSVIIGKIERRLKHNKRAAAVPLIRRLEHMGVRYATLNRFYAIALGQQFLFYKEHWDELPKSFLQAYPEGCYGYIQQRYGFGDQMADMYATVWEAFYSGRHVKVNQIPSYVRMSEIPIAKQRVAASYAIDGDMNVSRWKALADDTLDRKELVREMRIGNSKPKPGPLPSGEHLVIIKETGDLRLYDGGEIYELGHLDIRSNNPKVKKHILRILKRNHIDMRR